jgi:hypothetical protein
MLSEREKLLLETEPDYIYFKRFYNSIRNLEKRYADGCPDHVIAKAFGITEEELEVKYAEIITRLRKLMGV